MISSGDKDTMNCSQALADFAPPLRGSCESGSTGRVQQHCRNLHSPLSLSCRGTGTPVGTSSLGPRAIPLQNRGWLPGGEHSRSHCPPRPPLSRGFPRVFSRWAAAARFLRHRSVSKGSANRSALPCLRIRIPGPAPVQQVGAACGTGSRQRFPRGCFGDVAQNQAGICTCSVAL